MPRHITNAIQDSGCSKSNMRYSYTTTPKREGADAMRVRAYDRATLAAVVLELPNGCELEHMVREQPAGEYWHTKLFGGVHVHIRGGKTAKPGEKIVGKALIFTRTWEPEGAQQRGRKRTHDTHRNYTYCIDIEPMDEDQLPTKRIHIMDTSHPDYSRLKSDEVGPTTFAHLSEDGKRNQHIVVTNLATDVKTDGSEVYVVGKDADGEPGEGDTAMKQAMEDAGLSADRFAAGSHASA